MYYIPVYDIPCIPYILCMHPIIAHVYAMLLTLSIYNLLQNFIVTALLEMICITYHHMVCYVCHTCTDILFHPTYSACNR